jgi:hypothetical protein
VAAGSGVAALLPLAVLIAFLITLANTEQAWGFLVLATVLLSVPFAIVLVSAALVGLPTAYLLRRSNLESAFAYTCTGCTFGFLIPLGYGVFVTKTYGSGWWLMVIGALAGGVTGYTWWRTRPDAL